MDKTVEEAFEERWGDSAKPFEWQGGKSIARMFYLDGAAYGEARERERIRAILEFYPDISGKSLMNAADEVLP